MPGAWASAIGRLLAQRRYVMDTKRFSRLLLVSLAVLLALVPFTTTFAYPSEIHTEVTHDVFDFDCALFGLPYTVRFEDTITSRQFTFYDANGSPVRQMLHLLINGTVTNLTTGTRFTDRSSTK